MTTLYTLGHSLTRRLVGVLPADHVRRLEDGQATEADMRAAARELRESGDAVAADLVLWVLDPLGEEVPSRVELTLTELGAEPRAAATEAEQLEREAEWCAAECEAQRMATGHEEPTPACAVCGSVATCFGLYESDEEEDWAYACDVCCGHGNEDGTCKPVEDLGALWRAAAVRTSVIESDLSRAQLRIQKLKSKVDFYKEKAGRAAKATATRSAEYEAQRLATVTIKPGAEPTCGAEEPSASELLASLVLEWMISPQAAAIRLGSVLGAVNKMSSDVLDLALVSVGERARSHARAALARKQERLNETEARVNAALELAQRGWAVVPVCPGDKGRLRPALDPATDPVHIRDWWRGTPDANIGIATGPLSGIWVLDIDGDVGGAALAELEAEHGTLPATLTARTPRGLHLYWRGCAVRNGVSIGAGLDVRGDGGYVVAPGSRHHSGAIYEWVEPRADVVDAPAWLLKLAGSGRHHG